MFVEFYCYTINSWRFSIFHLQWRFRIYLTFLLKYFFPSHLIFLFFILPVQKGIHTLFLGSSIYINHYREAIFPHLLVSGLRLLDNFSSVYRSSFYFVCVFLIQRNKLNFLLHVLATWLLILHTPRLPFLNRVHLTEVEGHVI